jgi:hypothetical protein
MSIRCFVFLKPEIYISEIYISLTRNVVILILSSKQAFVKSEGKWARKF